MHDELGHIAGDGPGAADSGFVHASPWGSLLTVHGVGLTAQIAPSRGAKIVSLFGAGREWLAQPAEPLSPPSRPGADFVSAEMAGWDECAPSIVACQVDGEPIQDHGELWTTDFEVRGDAVVARTPSFEFERRAAATPSGIRFSYRVSTHRSSLPFLWAGHPQFVAPAGSRVELGSDVGEVIDVLAPEPARVAWDGAIDSLERGGCRKLYVDPAVRVTSADLVHPDGARLRLAWSPVVPYLGVWFDHGAFSREPVIAIEPATGYFDSLATAIEAGEITVVTPDRPLEWWVEVEAIEPRH